MRLKRNIEPMRGDALAMVRRLKGVTFEWREHEGPEGRYMGLIAQEVRKVAPQAVLATDESRLGLEVKGLIALLVESTKTLDKRLSAIELRLATL
jgi:hypothetical protein